MMQKKQVPAQYTTSPPSINMLNYPIHLISIVFS